MAEESKGLISDNVIEFDTRTTFEPTTATLPQDTHHWSSTTLSPSSLTSYRPAPHTRPGTPNP
jgi:hypothetical protein